MELHEHKKTFYCTGALATAACGRGAPVSACTLRDGAGNIPSQAHEEKDQLRGEDGGREGGVHHACLGSSNSKALYLSPAT